MAKMTPTQIRTTLNDIQTKTAAFTKKLKKREKALKKEVNKNLVDSIINSRLPAPDHPLKREIKLVTHTVDGQELRQPFDSAKRLLQIDVILQNTQQNIQRGTEENERLTLQQQALTTEITDLNQQLIALGVTPESAAQIIPLIQQSQTVQAEEIDDLLIQLADLGVTTDLADQIAFLNQAKEEKQGLQNQTNNEIESLRTYLTEEHEKIELLQRIQAQFNEDRQLLQNQIKNVEKFRTKLEKENDEVLGINNTLSLETANKKLIDIHKATSQLIEPISSEIIDISDDLKTIQDKRSALLSNLVEDVADEELAKDVYLDFQYQVATISAGKSGSTVTGANYKPSSQAEIDKLLKQLKTQRQIEREGIKIYLRADGSLQGPDNPANVKAKVDMQILLIKEKNKQLQVPKPVKLTFNQYDSGSEEAHIIGMQHALAHGADHAEIVNADKEGEKWNKIFNVYFDLQANPNNKKLFSEGKESKYTQLIRELNFEKEAESKDLIQKTLSALEPEQISKVLEDLSADRDTTLFDKTIDLIPSIIKERWSSDINKTFKGMDSSNKAKLLYACVKHEQESSNRMLSWIQSWFNNQEIKIPQYIKKLINETSKNDLLKIFKKFDPDPDKLTIKNALLNASGIAPNELQNNENESDDENESNSDSSDESDESDNDDDEESEEDGALNPVPRR